MTRKIDPPPRDDLEQKYSIPHCSISALAKEYGVSNPTVRKWLDHYGIVRKSHDDICRELNATKKVSIPSKDVLVDIYSRNSFADTWKFFGTSQKTLYEWFDHYQLELRTLSDSCTTAKQKQFEHIQFSKEQILEAYTTHKNCHLAAESLGISYSHFANHRRKYDIPNLTTRSVMEGFLFSYCGEDFYAGDRKLLHPLELDIYSPSRKLGIEYCGLYYHSEHQHGKTSKYHRQKFELCRNQGIDLLTIFESDDLEKVKDLIDKRLGRVETIHGRNTTLEQIDQKAANQFHNDYHLHNTVGSSKSLGLIHNGELVMVASFSKSRFNKKYEWECARMTSKRGIRVMGGASKLFKYFLSEHPSLITYADLRFGHGDVYKHCGLKFAGYTVPNYWYFLKKGPCKLYSRVSFQKHRLKDKLEYFDPSLTEFQNMINNGWDRIWDCGNSIWVSH